MHHVKNNGYVTPQSGWKVVSHNGSPISACCRMVHEHCMEFRFLMPILRNCFRGWRWSLGKFLSMHNLYMLFISFIHVLLCNATHIIKIHKIEIIQVCMTTDKFFLFFIHPNGSSWTPSGINVPILRMSAPNTCFSDFKVHISSLEVLFKCRF